MESDHDQDFAFEQRFVSDYDSVSSDSSKSDHINMPTGYLIDPMGLEESGESYPGSGGEPGQAEELDPGQVGDLLPVRRLPSDPSKTRLMNRNTVLRRKLTDTQLELAELKRELRSKTETHRRHLEQVMDSLMKEKIRKRQLRYQRDQAVYEFEVFQLKIKELLSREEERD